MLYLIFLKDKESVLNITTENNATVNLYAVWAYTKQSLVPHNMTSNTTPSISGTIIRSSNTEGGWAKEAYSAFDGVENTSEAYASARNASLNSSDYIGYIFDRERKINNIEIKYLGVHGYTVKFNVVVEITKDGLTWEQVHSFGEFQPVWSQINTLQTGNLLNLGNVLGFRIKFTRTYMESEVADAGGSIVSVSEIYCSGY